MRCARAYSRRFVMWNDSVALPLESVDLGILLALYEASELSAEAWSQAGAFPRNSCTQT